MVFTGVAIHLLQGTFHQKPLETFSAWSNYSKINLLAAVTWYT